jgi:uncharacterized membrane protein YcaP (DUF421 family)
LVADYAWLCLLGVRKRKARIINWEEIFGLSDKVPELIIRGSIVYLSIFALFRFVLKRVTGTLNLGDLLIIVLIADAAQNAMSAEYNSLTDGLVLVGTIMFWSYLLDWLAYKFPAFERVMHPPPVPLVRDGQMIARNMRRELITVDELMSHLREQGVENVKEVESASMEGDGRISVVKYEDGKTHPQTQEIN